MTEARASRRWMAIGLAAVAGIAAGSAAVYLSGTGNGNGGAVLAATTPDATAAGDCAPAVSAAKELTALAKGEIAAFQPATQPVSLADLSFKDGSGKSVTLADFKGKTVLLNLWATWCAPCRQEMPALDRLEASAGGENFAVVPVSIDTGSTEKPQGFLKEIGVAKLPFYADPSTEIFLGLKGRGLAFGLPTTILIDKNSCKLGAMAGPAEWDSEDAKALIAKAGGV